MSRIKLVLLGCIAALAVGAVASSSAFATFEETAVECKAPGISTLCLSTSATAALKEAKGTEVVKVIGLDKVSILKVPSLELEIECTKAGGEATLNQTAPLTTSGTVSAGVITFSTCAIIGKHAVECKVVEPIKTKSLKGTILEAEPNHLEFAPTEGTTFANIEVGNQAGQTCPATIKGTNPVKGTQLCVLLEAEVNAVVHLLECIETGSLEFGTNPASLSAEFELELASKKFWDSVLA